MSLFTLAGALGLLSHGGLSRATVLSEDGQVSIDYDRMARVGALSTLNFRVGGSAAGGDTIAISIGQEYLDSVEIQSVVPAPLRVVGETGRQRFEFASARAAGVRVIQFQVEPLRASIEVLRLGVNQGRELRLRYMVYP